MKTTIKTGIMQGRLSPQIGDTIQSFPVGTWQDEFLLAQKAGLNCIEWIYETGTDQINPLRNLEGIREIRKLEKESSVMVRSICADYYMNIHLLDPSGLPVPSVKSHLEWLIGQASRLECQYIILPFVDSSSLKTHEQIMGLETLLRSIVPMMEKNSVEIHLETDLPPSTIAGILSSLDHKLIRANYDIGNSASLGYNPREELPLLKQWVGSVHVKDRMKSGGTVPLGSGAADFAYCFNGFQSIPYNRPYILQAARENNISEVDLAIRNRTFVESFLS